VIANKQTRRRPNVNGGSNDPSRSTWCTPAWLAEAIGRFELDPCSNDRSHIRATQRLSLEEGDDGLAFAIAVAPERRVFVNPPYENGSVLEWFRAYKHTRFCFLLRFDPSTAWFSELYRATSLVCLPRGRRVNFEPPPGVRASSNTFPHGLFYRDEADATPAILRACFSWRPR
jgi:hypothetical protein